jgi:hypothetical protein
MGLPEPFHEKAEHSRLGRAVEQPVSHGGDPFEVFEDVSGNAYRNLQPATGVQGTG